MPSRIRCTVRFRGPRSLRRRRNLRRARALVRRVVRDVVGALGLRVVQLLVRWSPRRRRGSPQTRYGLRGAGMLGGWEAANGPAEQR